MEKPDAFVLIGGRSSRLGRDKAFVEIGGRSLILRAADTLRESDAVSGITLAAGDSTRFAIEATRAGLPFIFDLHEGRGPIGGLHASLAYARTPWILVLACDYPFVSPGLIRLLSDKISDEVGAVIARQHDGRLQPLCGFYNVAAATPIISTTIERPHVPPPMHELVLELNPRIVTFDEYEHLPGSRDLFANVNTPQDLENAREIQRKLSGSD